MNIFDFVSIGIDLEITNNIVIVGNKENEKYVNAILYKSTKYNEIRVHSPLNHREKTEQILEVVKKYSLNEYEQREILTENNFTFIRIKLNKKAF